MKNLFRKIINKWVLPKSQLTWSQAGEDILLANLFYKLDIAKPTYLDIGANHPSYISNTFYFYIRGSKGVCIEPNPGLYNRYKKARPRDTVLNIGIGMDAQTEADFYVFPEHAHGLGTFSKKEAEYWKDTGMKKVGKIAYERVIRMPLRPINDVLAEYFPKAPDLVSLDVEGLDLAILHSLDFNKYRPIAFCVETLYYDDQQREHKNEDIIRFMESKGYSVYADTFINTLFLKKF